MDDQNQPIVNSVPPPAGSAEQQLAEKLKQANNVLVTVSANPSVDQLAACIGLTLVLTKMSKHASAVFSGAVPSTIEFLKPEETLEKTTDSLRDFIISLDKSKADKLRYKVEDKVVKIFITPYRSSISEKDLEFSQGDFNVDIVVALGVREQQELDQAITAHGRILHDAVVSTISTAVPSTLGSINWQESEASSLSEMVTKLVDQLGQNLLDAQIATALLTGIVAETQRFRNEKTTPHTMSASAALMAAGANQQLVATKLEPPEPPVPAEPIKGPPGAGGPSTQPPPGPGARPAPARDTLEVPHDDEKTQATPTTSLEDLDKETTEMLLKTKQIHIDDEGRVHWLDGEHESLADLEAESASAQSNRPMINEPPSLGGTLTANSRPEAYDPPTDALTLPSVKQPILDHNASSPGLPAVTPNANSTLSQIEEKVGSAHVNQADVTPNPTIPPSSPPPSQNLESLRNAVDQAAQASAPLPSPQAFGSQFAFDEQTLHPDGSIPQPPKPSPLLSPSPPPAPANEPPPVPPPLPPSIFPPQQ